MQVDFHLLRLLSSRICHDIIGPAGSLNFSFDILKEESPKGNNVDNKEAMDMINTSVYSLIAKLEFFRMSFGSASIAEGEAGLSRVKELIFNLFKEKDVNIKWTKDIDKAMLDFAKNDYFKLTLNVFLMIFYCLQRSAEITIYAKKINNSLGVAIGVKGVGVKLGIDNIQALRFEVLEKDLTPRNIQSYFTALLSKNIDAKLEAKDNMQGEIQFAYILQ